MKYANLNDLKMINEWMESRALPKIPEWSLPKIGFIVEDVACGFLIYMSNECGLLDFFISNPFATKEDREDAFDAIVYELEDLAKKCKLKILFANSKIKTMKTLAEKMGFEYMGEYSEYKKEL
jgi:hypothetical protein